LFLLSKWFQTKRFLWEFPIGSYVKLSSAVAAILVGVLKCRTQFWKRTTQESFQQSLVEIGSVVSEEKIFLKFHPPFFLEWRAGLSDTILKWDYPRTIPARFGLIWFSGFRVEDLNVIFYQNMPNLHNRYISAERKISQKNTV
jgi:hypothetical protein